jgi:hypothetical protein
MDNNGNYGYFEENNQLELDVLKFMMNDKEFDFGPKINKYFESLTEIPQKLNNLDNSFRQDLGMEIRIKSELMNRYRLHLDKGYRDKMIKIYQKEIVPCLEIEIKE